MKIKVYELRPDECAAYKAACGNLPDGFEISCETSALTPHSVDTLCGAEGIVVVNKTPMDADSLAAYANAGVKYIATRTIGFNHIDLDACRRLGIRVCNTTYPPYGVAEFAVMLMLIALRKYKPALWRQQVNDFSLPGLQGRELRTLTVGVVGTGRIGRAVIDCLQGFGCEVLAYDPYPSEELSKSGKARYVPLDAIYAQCDLITVHMPLNDETRGVIGRDAIDEMKDGVILVNVSRGELMDMDALIEGVESQKIGALAMDVFAGEDGIYHVNRTNDILSNRSMAYLRQFPNVVLTQHIAFYTDIDVDYMVEQGIAGIIGMSEGTWHAELGL